jgi:hypothetical protein
MTPIGRAKRRILTRLDRAWSGQEVHNITSIVARMSRSGIRGIYRNAEVIPDSISFHPGYTGWQDLVTPNANNTQKA